MNIIANIKGFAGLGNLSSPTNILGTEADGFRIGYFPIGEIKKQITVNFHEQTDLAIDGDNGDYFIIEISADETFSLSNIITGLHYYFLIKNTDTENIFITLPSGTNISPHTTIEINANKYVEVAMISNGTVKIWQISGEMS